MSKGLDESELRALFEEIGPPPELDARWRERVSGELSLEEPKPVTLFFPITSSDVDSVKAEGVANPYESPIGTAGGPPVSNATGEHRQFESVADSLAGLGVDSIAGSAAELAAESGVGSATSGIEVSAERAESGVEAAIGSSPEPKVEAAAENLAQETEAAAAKLAEGSDAAAEKQAEPEALAAKPAEEPEAAAEKLAEEAKTAAVNPADEQTVKAPTPTNPYESPIGSAGGPPVFNATPEDRQSEALTENPDPDPQEGATVITLPTEQELEPRSHRRRTIAVAAAAAVIVGLGGIVVTSQLLSNSPPADPTMIIDGPDKTVRSALPSTSETLDARPTGTPTRASGQPNESNDNGQPTTGGPVATYGDPGSDGPREPTWPTLIGDPTAANTGVPVAASLAEHHGDLRVSTPGEVVSDLRITGSIIVDAPNVTIRRVMVIAPDGVPAVRQNAGGLTVENSELTGGQSLAQGPGGLKVRRSRLENGVTVASDALLTDNYLGGADILVVSGATNVSVVHNSGNRVTMNDLDGAIRGVTIQNNLIMQVDAPTRAGSASVHVLGNRFQSSAPSTGWNPAAPDFQWSGNTFAGSGAVANP